jgi:hypothetical protein
MAATIRRRFVGLQAEEGRGVRLMAAIFALLNALFALVVLTTLPAEGLFPGMIWAALAVILAGLSFNARIQQRVHEWMGTTFAVFAPVVWYIALMFLVGGGNALLPRPLLWSAVQTWGATIFFWLGAYWLARYAARTVTLDEQRTRDWRLLVVVATIMCVVSMFVPGIFVNSVVIPSGYDERWALITRDMPPDEPTNLVQYITYFNTDVPEFINNSNQFPIGWVGADFKMWHRPTFYMVTSQVCRLLDIPFSGYASGSPTCEGIFAGMVAFWVVNLGIAFFSAIIVYELVRAYYDHPRVARMAGLLTVVTGFTLYFFPIISTDYVELFIALASLWMIHRLFLTPQVSTQRIIAYGLMFGILLLLKLNAIYLLFGLVLVVGTRRWRLIPVFTLIPLLVYGLYRVVVEMVGIPFVVLEATSEWPTVNWITTTFLFEMSLFEKTRSITYWTGMVFDKVFFMFGVLLIAGVLVMVLDTRYPRKLVAAAWLLFFCMAAFALVFRFTYVQHTIALIPFIYGAVALGADGIAEQVGKGERRNRLWARMLVALILLMPLLHNLVQIFAWGAKDWINYYGL